MRTLVKLSGILAVAIFTAVQAQATVLLNETFTYPDGALTNVSALAWVAHSGTAAQQFNVASGAAQIVPASGTDVNRLLAPVAQHSNDVLYAGFDVNFSIAPTATPTYFAHFKDSSTFNFFARVFGTNESGAVRMGIANGTTPAVGGAAGGYVGSTIAVGTTHRIILRLDQTGASAIATLWLDPTLESDPSASATDIPSVTNINVVAFALRQSTGEGTLSLDNLLVGTTFADVIPEPSTVMLVGIGVVGLLAIRRRRK